MVKKKKVKKHTHKTKKFCVFFKNNTDIDKCNHLFFWYFFNELSGVGKKEAGDLWENDFKSIDLKKEK